MGKSSGIILKNLNLNRLRKELKALKTATKASLSEKSGFSVVTVNSLLSELLASGEAMEDKVIPSGGGRPALTYSYNAHFRLAIVLMLNEQQGKDMLVLNVVNLFGECIEKEEHAMPQYNYKEFDNVIRRALNRFPQVSGIGIGIPGQSENGQITVSSHKNLKGVRLVEHLQAEFMLPVLLENDINAAVNGYCSHYIDNVETSVVGIYFPKNYPPGMGIYLNGSIEGGQYGMAGEIKYLPLQADWGSNLSDQNFIDVFCRITHIANVILAPNKIVIYQNKVDDSILREKWEAYQSAHFMPSKPETTFSQAFQTDFYEGIKALILQQLESDLLY